MITLTFDPIYGTHNRPKLCIDLSTCARDQDCAGADKTFALKPVNGQANGMHMSGAPISREDARISVAYCAEQMKNEPNCSKQYIGVSVRNGQCWCAKKSGNCSNFIEVTSYLGHFFQWQGENEGMSEGEMKGAIEVGSAWRLISAGMCVCVCAYHCIYLCTHPFAKLLTILPIHVLNCLPFYPSISLVAYYFTQPSICLIAHYFIHPFT